MCIIYTCIHIANLRNDSDALLCEPVRIRSRLSKYRVRTLTYSLLEINFDGRVKGINYRARARALSDFCARAITKAIKRRFCERERKTYNTRANHFHVLTYDSSDIVRM